MPFSPGCTTFPNERPDKHAPAMWNLQLCLLTEAERRFGPRDESKLICQPTFSADGPYLVNTPDFQGAFGTLSLNAAGYWPTAIQELAHETVHLLNPAEGAAPYLEEGMAVTFEIEMAKSLGTMDWMPGIPRYRDAWELVQRLPGGPYAAGRRIRERYGSFRAANAEGLKEIFGPVDLKQMARLMEMFPPKIRGK